MLAGVTDCRKSWKRGCRGRLALGFKLRHGSHTRESTTQLQRSRKGGSRGFRGEEGVGHDALTEWRLRGGGTADGARSLNHRLLLFLRYGTPDWAEGAGRTVWVCGYSKGL